MGQLKLGRAWATQPSGPALHTVVAIGCRKYKGGRISTRGKWREFICDEILLFSDDNGVAIEFFN